MVKAISKTDFSFFGLPFWSTPGGLKLSGFGVHINRFPEIANCYSKWGLKSLIM
jgi:hypothetical protein